MATCKLFLNVIGFSSEMFPLMSMRGSCALLGNLERPKFLLNIDIDVELESQASPSSDWFCDALHFIGWVFCCVCRKEKKGKKMQRRLLERVWFEVNCKVTVTLVKQAR